MAGLSLDHLSFLLDGAVPRAGLEGGRDAQLKSVRRMAVSMLDQFDSPSR